jgi:hypothetical protein
MHRSWLGICSSFIVANEEAIRATDNFKSLTREKMITMIAVSIDHRPCTTEEFTESPLLSSPHPIADPCVACVPFRQVRCPPIFTSPIRYVMHWLNAQDMEEDKDDDGKAGMEAMSIPSTSFGIVCEARLVFWAFELLATVRKQQHQTAPPDSTTSCTTTRTTTTKHACKAISRVKYQGNAHRVNDKCSHLAKWVFPSGRGAQHTTPRSTGRSRAE